MKIELIVGLLLVSACGASQRGVQPSQLEALCKEGSHFNGRTCMEQTSAPELVKAAEVSLGAENLDVDKALSLLAQALAKGPLDHETLIEIYKQQGIAYSYIKKKEETLAAFSMLLALDPGHVLQYKLPPQTTFLFEDARRSSQAGKSTDVQISWPQNRKVDEEVPLQVEVLGDPKKHLNTMALFLRYDKKSSYKRISLRLDEAGKVKSVSLPAADLARATTLELYGSAYNQEGDEVYQWFSPQQPREISLAYQKPRSWYKKWWVWTIAGAGVATATGATVYVLSLQPPDKLGGDVILGAW